MRYFSVIFLLLLLIAACEKQPAIKPKAVAGNKILVLNEGNFLWSNASLDLYDPQTNLLQENVYKLANGKALGDVLQSASIIQGNIWLVLNNSGKVVVIDTQNFKEKFSITGLRSPRYLCESGGKVWVSDLYAGLLTVVDASTCKVLKKISTGLWTEQLLNDGVGMAVACYDGWLRRYDTATFGIIDSMRLKSGLQWLQRDKNGNVWALCTDSGRSDLYRIQPVTKMVETIFIAKGKTASRLCKSRGGDTLFCIAGGLVSIPVESKQLPEPIFTQSGANFYGLYCDLFSGAVYLSDALDYVSRSQVYRLDSRGNVYGQFKAGIITTGFLSYK